jgi:hypothetical protein
MTGFIPAVGSIPPWLAVMGDNRISMTPINACLQNSATFVSPRHTRMYGIAQYSPSSVYSSMRVTPPSMPTRYRSRSPTAIHSIICSRPSVLSLMWLCFRWES